MYFVAVEVKLEQRGWESYLFVRVRGVYERSSNAFRLEKIGGGDEAGTRTPSMLEISLQP